MDGTTAVIEVSNADDLEWESTDKTKNTWFSYDEKNDGTYELGKLNSNDSASKDLILPARSLKPAMPVFLWTRASA